MDLFGSKAELYLIAALVVISIGIVYFTITWLSDSKDSYYMIAAVAVIGLAIVIMTNKYLSRMRSTPVYPLTIPNQFNRSVNNAEERFNRFHDLDAHYYGLIERLFPEGLRSEPDTILKQYLRDIRRTVARTIADNHEITKEDMLLYHHLKDSMKKLKKTFGV